MSLAEWVWDLKGRRNEVEEEVRGLLKLDKKEEKDSKKFLKLKYGSTKGLRYVDDLLQCSNNMPEMFEKYLITSIPQRYVGRNKRKMFVSVNIVEKPGSSESLSG